MSAAIRVFLVDDHQAFRQPLARLLQREPDLDVAAQVGSLAEARQALAGICGDVDVALIDLLLEDGDGLEAIRDFRARYPLGRVVVLSGIVDPAHLARATAAGATAIVSKAAHPCDIFDTVRRLHAGDGLTPST